MDPENQQSNITDISKPNAGRIYDYFCNGTHNFEIDRQAAEQIKKVAPFAPVMAQFVRFFLGEAIRRAVAQGFNQFLDFASGLPTIDHIHSIAPKGTKVIYSDIDQATVRYGREIIGENPIVKYVTCNAAKPEILLESELITNLFGENHKCVIGFNGICWFLSNEQISHAMKVLYEWADEGSILFLTDNDSENLSEQFQAFFALYEQMGQYVGIRPMKEFIELSKPWEIVEPGFLQLEEWVDIAPETTKKIVASWGGGGPFGGFLKK